MRRLVSLIAGALLRARAEPPAEPWGPGAALARHAAADAALHAAAAASSLTRDPRVVATCSVRGNLGPCGVVVQAAPGADWLRDRWQAASDMGGTAIKGAHWVDVDLGRPVVARTVVIDWEAAHADDYAVVARAAPGEGAWMTLFDAAVDAKRRSVAEAGASPGAAGVPLHVVHTLRVDSTVAFRELRVAIRRPARGWGVSVWQIDVFGDEAPAPRRLRGAAGDHSFRAGAAPTSEARPGGGGGQK